MIARFKYHCIPTMEFHTDYKKRLIFIRLHSFFLILIIKLNLKYRIILILQLGR